MQDAIAVVSRSEPIGCREHGASDGRSAASPGARSGRAGRLLCSDGPPPVTQHRSRVRSGGAGSTGGPGGSVVSPDGSAGACPGTTPQPQRSNGHRRDAPNGSPNDVCSSHRRPVCCAPSGLPGWAHHPVRALRRRAGCDCHPIRVLRCLLPVRSVPPGGDRSWAHSSLRRPEARGNRTVRGVPPHHERHHLPPGRSYVPVLRDGLQSRLCGPPRPLLRFHLEARQQGMSRGRLNEGFMPQPYGFSAAP